jgi:hypothetical protein
MEDTAEEDGAGEEMAGDGGAGGGDEGGWGGEGDAAAETELRWPASAAASAQGMTRSLGAGGTADEPSSENEPLRLSREARKSCACAGLTGGNDAAGVWTTDGA